MRKVSVKQQLAMDYLRKHPELHTVGAKRLAAIVDNPKVAYMTWYRSKLALGLPVLKRGGQPSSNPKQKAQRALKTPNLPTSDETVAIIVDKPLLTICFHRRSGLQVQRSKPNRKYLNASLALFEAQGWVTVEERGGVVVLKK